jgi:hypothetical protein
LLDLRSGKITNSSHCFLSIPAVAGYRHPRRKPFAPASSVTETTMTYDMIVQLPVSVAFGTDEEFDLRVQLERELAAALTRVRAGKCAGGGIDTSHMNLHLEDISDPPAALGAVKEVLTAAGLLARSVIVLETRSAHDPDDRDLQVLWPPNHSGMFRVA